MYAQRYYLMQAENTMLLEMLPDLPQRQCSTIVLQALHALLVYCHVQTTKTASYPLD